MEKLEVEVVYRLELFMFLFCCTFFLSCGFQCMGDSETLNL